MFYFHMIFASGNLYMAHYLLDKPNAIVNIIVHLLMFGFCMLKGWEQSKKDGTII